MECTHPHLTKEINTEAGGEASTIYRCDNCGNLLTVHIQPLTIKVSQPSNTGTE